MEEEEEKGRIRKVKSNKHIARNKGDIVIDFRRAFHGRKIPLVTLDERWLDLFPPEDMSPRMKELQQKMNELLKSQGRAVEEIKGYKRYKTQLMQEIVDNMDVDSSFLGKVKERKLEKNQKMILNLNEQLEQSQEELADIPKEIKNTNEDLMVETTKVGFDRLLVTGRKINAVKNEIQQMEQELRELKRQEKYLEQVNRDVYLYMNDMLGTEVMRQIDEAMEE